MQFRKYFVIFAMFLFESHTNIFVFKTFQMRNLHIFAIILLLVSYGCKKDDAGNTEPPRTEVKVETVGDVEFEMACIGNGTFKMGATSEQMSYALESEYPMHSVTLSRYYISTTEVTQGLWNAVMGKDNQLTDSLDWNDKCGVGDRYPAYNVSWDDCQKFISRLNEITGKHFRLPTEAEWEFAARGGAKSESFLFSGSNNWDDVAWNYENSGYRCHETATLKPNKLGIYDMSGNVEEWCSDWYGAYSVDSQYNPAGPLTGWPRVIRGGTWNSNYSMVRVTCRNWNYPNERCLTYGFRLVLNE